MRWQDRAGVCFFAGKALYCYSLMRGRTSNPSRGFHGTHH